MTTLAEIESAAAMLPRLQQELLLEHLAAKLRAESGMDVEAEEESRDRVKWPDYEGRLKEIYGDKVMPSMVLFERESASW